jgi:hypothetical protein
MTANQKEMKAKMDPRLEVKASHKMMEAKMTNQEQTKVGQQQ